MRESGTNVNVMVLSLALFSKSRNTCEVTLAKSKGIRSKTSFPDSIFEKSRMSETMLDRCWAENFKVSRYSRWVGLSCSSMSRSAMPITPLIGVLISWLMLAKNSDLAIAACFWAVMSWSVPFSPTICPSLSLIASPIQAMYFTRPSLKIARCSTWNCTPVCTVFCMASSSLMRSTGWHFSRHAPSNCSSGQFSSSKMRYVSFDQCNSPPDRLNSQLPTWAMAWASSYNAWLCRIWASALLRSAISSCSFMFFFLIMLYKNAPTINKQLTNIKMMTTIIL